MAMNFSHRKKVIRLSYALAVLIIGITFMLAFISTQRFLRVDLTENQEFAISDSSKEIMNSLDDIVTVKVFFSKELPPNLVAVRQYVGDILEELMSYSNNNLAVHFLDPSQESVAQEARLLGIPAVRMNILSRDKFEVKNGFLGVAFMYAGQHQVLPIVQNTNNIEYDLVASINKLTRSEPRRIGFLTGHGEVPIETPRLTSADHTYSEARLALEKNYAVTSVSLSEANDLNSIDTLVVGGPTFPLSRLERIALDQYIMRGGDVVFLLDRMSVKDFLEASALDLKLYELLSHYGVTVEPSLVLDELNETVSFTEGLIDLVLPYPFWVKAVADHFELTHPIVNTLDVFVLPWVSPLTLHPSEGVRATALVNTSPHASFSEPPFVLDPNVKSLSQGEDQYPLIALLEGSFSSFYATDERSSSLLTRSDGTGRILVIGNSRFLTNQMIGRYKQNLNLFLNAIDYLTLDEDLIDIRSKAVVDRPLKPLSDTERQLIKWLGIFLVPVFVVVYGVTRQFERHRRPPLF